MGRYATYTAGPTVAAASNVSRAAVAAADIPVLTPLAREFAMAEQQQQANRSRTGRMRRLRQKRWFWPVVGVPTVLMLVAAIVFAPVMWSTWQAYRQVQVDDVEHIESAYVPQLNVAGTPELVAAPTEMTRSSWNGDEPINILLLGADLSVEGISRTDTIIIVNIDPEERTARMMSIPRDLKVVIPGYGLDKINAAFAIGDYNNVQGGGAGLTIRTIEANFGVPIHAFVQVDFQGFIRMIDTVGGVTVDVPYPIKDDTYPAEGNNYQRIYFPAGWQQLSGDEALVYARTRHQDGDTRRSARQQQVLLALRDQAISLDLISQLPELIDQFGDSVRTDIGLNDARRLAQVGLSIPRDQIVSSSIVPALYEDPGEDGTYYLNADWTLAAEILTEFAGVPVNPPGAALANPNYSARVLILNGTYNEGLAGRVGTMLEWNGFVDISVDQAANVGNYDRTTVLDPDGNLGTSAMVTNLIGVGADTIMIGDTTPEGESIADLYGDYDLIITLGNDTPDPSGAEWTLEDYQRAAEDDGALEPSSPDLTEPEDTLDEPEDDWTEDDDFTDEDALPAEPAAPEGHRIRSTALVA